ncbi:hypothetical protein CYMTET_17405, partial [Cymbomonas tetramitiformis]
MGITTEEWLKLPEAKQQRAAASAEVQDRLAAELSSMQTARQAGGDRCAEAQARSDDEEDEAEYDSNFDEREEYAADVHIGSAGEEVVADWSTIEAATKINHKKGTSTGSSSQTWLTREEVKELQQQSSLTVFMVSVGVNSTHVLRYRENPNAKPVCYIFEDNGRHEKDIFQFTDKYLQDEQRKFTGLTYVTALESAPWVQLALMLLERRLVRSPAAIVEQAREAHVARRSEHTDEDMIDARALDR